MDTKTIHDLIQSGIPDAEIHVEGADGVAIRTRITSTEPQR